MYWNNAMVLSLPLLFAKNIEKYVEKSLAFITRCLKGSLAPMAFSRKLIIDAELLKGIFSITITRIIIIAKVIANMNQSGYHRQK